jgi:hypothetical protein
VIICPFRAMTGLSCPLCGSTRATVQLLTGHPAHAFKLNALYVALLPLALYALVAKYGTRTGRWRLPELRMTRLTTWALLVVALGFAVVRNLPGLHAWSALGT